MKKMLGKESKLFGTVQVVRGMREFDDRVFEEHVQHCIHIPTSNPNHTTLHTAKKKIKLNM